MANRIHNDKVPKRLELGAPFIAMAQLVLKSTNKNNLSRNWTKTDAARWLMAEGAKAHNLPISLDAKAMLKPFYKDLDTQNGVHSAKHIVRLLVPRPGSDGCEGCSAT